MKDPTIPNLMGEKGGLIATHGLPIGGFQAAHAPAPKPASKSAVFRGKEAGVLQRIAICYLIGALIFLYTSWRGQALAIVGVCTAYWMLMTLYPVMPARRVDAPCAHAAEEKGN